MSEQAHLPRLTWRDWVRAVDVHVLQAIAVFSLAMRLPGSFILFLAAPVIVIAVRGLRLRPGLGMGLLWATILLCLGPALGAAAVLDPKLLVNPTSNWAIMVAVALNLVAVAYTGRPVAAAATLFRGFVAGMYAVWAVSMAEIVTGIKLLPLMYPDANTAAAVRGRRFFVSATYPNYNDYSVLMAMLCAVVVAQAVFSKRGTHPAVWLLRVGVLFSAAGLIAYMGSRGALIGLMAMIALVLVMGIRAQGVRVFTPRRVLIGGLLLLMAAGVVLNSPYVQDNSTRLRGVIAGNIFAMLAGEPVHAVLGFGSAGSYSMAATALYGKLLMDPHNLLLELIVWFGVFGLLGFALSWIKVVWSGFLKMDVALNWRSVSGIVIVTALPLLGIVPSSTLRYHWPWILLISVLVPMAAWRRDVVDRDPDVAALERRLEAQVDASSHPSPMEVGAVGPTVAGGAEAAANGAEVRAGR